MVSNKPGWSIFKNKKFLIICSRLVGNAATLTAFLYFL